FITQKLILMHLHYIRIFLFFLFFLLAFSGVQKIVCQSDVLVLEWEQHWDTYGIGGTCCYGTQNFYVGDIDGDQIEELITGGFSYRMENDTRISYEAPLRVWNWNGSYLQCECSQSWKGSIRTLYAFDLDKDGFTEIITGGISFENSKQIPQINIWTYDGVNILQKGSFEGISANSIFVIELNKHEKPLLLTAGRIFQDNKTYAQLSVFQWNENGLSLLDSQKWCSLNEADAYSVFAYDLNSDGEIEIITGGYDNDLINSCGQLRIWSLNNNNLVLENNTEWQMIPDVYGVTISGLPMGNTAINDVKVEDVDSDGVPEIITGGWTYDGQVFNGQLRIWNFNGEDIVLENSQEWISEDITEIKSISIDDVDNDNEIEIVTSGLTAVYGSFNNTECTPDHSQLRIWNWKDDSLILELSKDWTIGDGVVAWNLETSDIDNDGTVEIITVGCMGVSGLCDPDLRIWSIIPSENSFLDDQIFVVALIIVLGLIGIIFLIKRK
ncbi:MAG: hypothetical protein P8Y18_04765, partial [Candidatus Bathyarchaeota archaeon]